MFPSPTLPAMTTSLVKVRSVAPLLIRRPPVRVRMPVPRVPSAPA